MEKEEVIRELARINDERQRAELQIKASKRLIETLQAVCPHNFKFVRSPTGSYGEFYSIFECEYCKAELQKEYRMECPVCGQVLGRESNLNPRNYDKTVYVTCAHCGYDVSHAWWDR